jgi:hypothetical protein
MKHYEGWKKLGTIAKGSYGKCYKICHPESGLYFVEKRCNLMNKDERVSFNSILEILGK